MGSPDPKGEAARGAMSTWWHGDMGDMGGEGGQGDPMRHGRAPDMVQNVVFDCSLELFFFFVLVADLVYRSYEESEANADRYKIRKDRVESIKNFRSNQVGLFFWTATIAAANAA